MQIFQPKPSLSNGPYLIAHRGISAKFPENTLISFKRAADTQGIDMIELDVRLTKDNEVVVIHDRTLQRTTTGNGFVRNYLLEEIKQFDAGSWFNPSFADQRVPTLREVLELIGDKVWIDIEIKSDFYPRLPKGLIEEKVLEVVDSCKAKDNVMFSSFNHKLLENIKKIKAEAVVGVLYNFPYDFRKLPSELAEKVGASIFVCAKRELRYYMIEDAHKHNIAVYVYTLNSKKGVERMINLEVDGIISNNADDLVELVKNHRNK